MILECVVTFVYLESRNDDYLASFHPYIGSYWTEPAMWN